MRTRLLIIFVLFFNTVQSQETPPHRISVEARLPTGTSNPAFKAVIQDIAHARLDYGLHLIKGIRAGVGYAHYFGRVDDVTLLLNRPSNGSVNGMAPYGFLGYERWLNEQWMLEAKFAAGYSWMNHQNNICPENTGNVQQEGSYFEPSVGVNIVAQPGVLVSFTVGYTFFGQNFRPGTLCMANFPGFSDDSYVGTTQYLSFGFGFSFLPGKRGGEFVIPD